jgi:hypothetical protein
MYLPGGDARFGGDAAHGHCRESFGQRHAHRGLEDLFPPLVLAQITHNFSLSMATKQV